MAGVGVESASLTLVLLRLVRSMPWNCSFLQYIAVFLSLYGGMICFILPFFRAFLEPVIIHRTSNPVSLGNILRGLGVMPYGVTGSEGKGYSI